MTKAAKGSKFEREICTQLSLWWTKGKRDDIFWRTAGSGARAKTRGRKGKTTSGQDGDLAAIDPSGRPLINVLTIEIKRGYNKHTPYDCVDKPERAAAQMWDKWLLQAKESRKQSGSYSYAIITRRDRRETMIFLRSDVLSEIVSWSDNDLNKLTNKIEITICSGPKKIKTVLCGIRLSDFLVYATPYGIKKLSKLVDEEETD